MKTLNQVIIILYVKDCGYWMTTDLIGGQLQGEIKNVAV